jgi:hypothetical protein
MPPKRGGIVLDFTASCAPAAVSSNSASNIRCFTSEFSATSQAPELDTGHYTSDLKSGKYELSWPSLAAMEAWIIKEERANFIELKLKDTILNDKLHWDEKYVLVCARQGTGGAKPYEKKKPSRGRKVPTKRIKCPCRLVAKTYPNSAQVLGTYKKNHSHLIGPINAKFTALSLDTRTVIEEKLRAGVGSQRIVSFLFVSSLTTLLTLM